MWRKVLRARASNDEGRGLNEGRGQTLGRARAVLGCSSLPRAFRLLSSVYALPLSRYRLLLSTFCLLLAAYCLLLPTRSVSTTHRPTSDPANLLEIGSPSRPPVPPAPAPEIRVVSYNIRWRAGEELQEIIKFLREDAEAGGAAIIGLQEVDRDKKRTGNVNTARVIAEALQMHYVWAAPPPEPDAEEEETGVAILSPYPMEDVVRLVLPHEGPKGRRRAAIGATVRLGAQPLRVYSLHSETRLATEKKVAQWRAVLEDLARYPKVQRAIVLGDFNSIKGDDRREARKLFTEAGFATPVPDNRTTFQRYFFVKLKLDWIWLRQLEATGGGVSRRIDVSDHWPLWVSIKTGTPTSDEGAKMKGKKE